jgi:electron transport complex protein RnfC
MEELIRLRIDICMECGCCSYSCPAAKPLVETNKLSKAAVREYSEKKRKSESEKKEEKK